MKHVSTLYCQSCWYAWSFTRSRSVCRRGCAWRLRKSQRGHAKFMWNASIRNVFLGILLYQLKILLRLQTHNIEGNNTYIHPLAGLKHCPQYHQVDFSLREYFISDRKTLFSVIWNVSSIQILIWHSHFQFSRNWESGNVRSEFGGNVRSEFSGNVRSEWKWVTVATELHVIGRLKIKIRVTPDLHQQDINPSAAQLIFL